MLRDVTRSVNMLDKVFFFMMARAAEAVNSKYAGFFTVQLIEFILRSFALYVHHLMSLIDALDRVNNVI